MGKLVLAKEVGADILKRRLFPSEPVGVGQLECGCTQSQLVLTVVKKHYKYKTNIVVFPIWVSTLKYCISIVFNCLHIFLRRKKFLIIA